MSKAVEESCTRDGTARTICCGTDRTVRNWGPNCSRCKGDGVIWDGYKTTAVHQRVMCPNCQSTGRDPIPWAELFSGWTR